jgi:rhodanese-related sulfurtransferase
MNTLKNTMLIITLYSLMSCFQVNGANILNLDSIQANFSSIQCDSLVQTNAANPDFVILDVRTPAEYLPSHLPGAINRNYYDTDFAVQIGQLPHHKMYMIHCAAGSRSAQVYNLMLTLGFPSVINMLGGINAWNAAGFPVTNTLAPLQMAVSDTTIPIDTVLVGLTDSIQLTITNRANDTLRVTSITDLAGTEFSSNFDTNLALTGPFDYSFTLYYTPTDTLADTLVFRIESNGGPIQFHVIRTGKIILTSLAEITLPANNPQFRNYPNPFTTITSLEFNLLEGDNITITVLDLSGRAVKVLHHAGHQGKNILLLDMCELQAGTYISTIEGKRYSIVNKMIKR